MRDGVPPFTPQLILLSVPEFRPPFVFFCLQKGILWYSPPLLPLLLVEFKLCPFPYHVTALNLPHASICRNLRCSPALPFALVWFFVHKFLFPSSFFAPYFSSWGPRGSSFSFRVVSRDVPGNFLRASSWACLVSCFFVFPFFFLHGSHSFLSSSRWEFVLRFVA